MGKFAVGSVVLVIFPFSNLKGQKVRPALVLASVEFGNLNAKHQDLLILCQITSKSYTSKIAICIKSEDFVKGNLPVVSYVRPDKLFTADATIIKDVVGQLTPAIKNELPRSRAARYRFAQVLVTQYCDRATYRMVHGSVLCDNKILQRVSGLFT